MGWPIAERAEHKAGDRRMIYGREFAWSGSRWRPVEPTKAAEKEPQPAKEKSEEASILEKYKLKFTGPGHEKLAKAVEKGIDKAADLCKITPPVCRGNLGVSRDKMPQFPDNKVRDSFLGEMRKQGVRVTEGKVRVGQLKASQEEIQAKKTVQMAGQFLDGKFPDIKNAIVISKDGYIVDGHHRWAALLAVSPGEEMNVIRVGVPIKALLDMVNKHPGVEKRSITAASIGQEKKEWVDRLDGVLRRAEALNELRSSRIFIEKYIRLSDALGETMVGQRGFAYAAQPVSIHGVGISPSAAPADREAGRHQLYADGPTVRRKKPGYKPVRAGAGSVVQATKARS